MHHIPLSALEKRAKVVFSSLSYLQTAAWRDGWTCRLDKDTRQTTRDESDGDKRRRETEGKLQVWLHQPVFHSSVISKHQREGEGEWRRGAWRKKYTHIQRHYFIRLPITEGNTRQLRLHSQRSVPCGSQPLWLVTVHPKWLQLKYSSSVKSCDKARTPFLFVSNKRKSIIRRHLFFISVAAVKPPGTALILWHSNKRHQNMYWNDIKIRLLISDTFSYSNHWEFPCALMVWLFNTWLI